MSYYTGIATDYQDFLDKIVTAATEVGNDWQIVEDMRGVVNKRWIILKGVGDDGLQEIYVGFQKYADPVGDNYGMTLMGFIGYQNGNDFYAQPGAIPYSDPGYHPTVPLWNSDIQYWICVNKRRITFVAKISTSYFSGYLGYILPFASVGQFPYPIYIGGTNRYRSRYDDVSQNQSHFMIPYLQGGRLRNVDGNWKNFANNLQQQYDYAGTYPYSEHTRGNYNGGWFNIRKTPNSGGDLFPLQPVLLFEGQALFNHRGNIFGQFDGVYHCAGLDNAAENIITIGGQEYLVVQNVFRTTPRDFWALKLV